MIWDGYEGKKYRELKNLKTALDIMAPTNFLLPPGGMLLYYLQKENYPFYS